MVCSLYEGLARLDTWGELTADLDIGHVPEVEFTEVVASGDLRAVWREGDTIGLLPALLEHMPGSWDEEETDKIDR